jgi:hypothetical protein
MNTYTYINPITKQEVSISSKREYSHIVLSFGLPASLRSDGVDYSKDIVASSLCGSLKKAMSRVESPRDLIITLTKIS